MNEDWKQRLICAISGLVHATEKWAGYNDRQAEKREAEIGTWEREVETIVDEGVGGFEAMKRVLQGEVGLLKRSLSDCRKRCAELREEIDDMESIGDEMKFE